MDEIERAYNLGRKHGFCEIGAKIDETLRLVEVTNPRLRAEIKSVRELTAVIVANRAGSAVDPLKVQRDRIVDEICNDAVLSTNIPANLLERIVEIVEG
jgi:hypothetical protein